MTLFQPRDRRPVDQQVLEQALHWMVLLQSGVSSEGDRLACDAWRSQSSEHERAWQRLAGINHDLRGTTQALPAGSARTLLRSRAGSSRRTLLKGFIGLTVLAGTGVGLRERALLPELFSDYRTHTGERRRVQLAGGAQLQLDTRTALDAEGLDLALNLGRVLIDAGAQSGLRLSTTEGWVSPAPSSRVVIARDLPGISGTLVQVFAGSASVALPHGDSQTLNAGQQLIFPRNQAPSLATVAGTALAWTDGLLIAERMPLSLLLEYLDRYRRGVIRCAPSVAGLQVSGSWSLDHPDASLDLLARTLPLRIDRVLGLWATVTPV